MRVPISLPLYMYIYIYSSLLYHFRDIWR